MSSPPITLYFLLAAMVILWAGNYVVAKIVLRQIPAILLISIRTVIAGAIMAPFYWRRLKRAGQYFQWHDLGVLLVLGFFGITMNQFCFVMGIGRTTVTHSAIIMSTIPVWVLLFATALGMERITGAKIAGMAMAISGVVVLQAFRSQSSAVSHPTLLGDFFVLLCALLLASMTTLAKRWKPGDTVAVVAVGYIAGAIVFAPVVWWQTRTFDLRSVTPYAWAGVLYMAGFCSVVCYVIYNYALRHIAASRVAATQYLQPFFATMLAVIILGERLTAPVVAAGGIIIAGVLVTERLGAGSGGTR